jgi:hypothetical protein
MSVIFPFEFRRLGDFMYHVISDPQEIRAFVMKWAMGEWEFDHSLAPEEHWTVKWMGLLPKMKFSLEIIDLDDICPHADLWSMEQFHVELKERADDREQSILRGMSIEPLLVNRDGLELMDGYTRYTVLKRYKQKQVYVYLGEVK